MPTIVLPEMAEVLPELEALDAWESPDNALNVLDHETS
jgi:hypothetical protein